MQLIRGQRLEPQMTASNAAHAQGCERRRRKRRKRRRRRRRKRRRRRRGREKVTCLEDQRYVRVRGRALVRHSCRIENYT